MDTDARTHTHTNDAMRFELQSLLLWVTEEVDVDGTSFSSSDESGNNSFNKSSLWCFLVTTCSGAGL